MPTAVRLGRLVEFETYRFTYIRRNEASSQSATIANEKSQMNVKRTASF